jgi:hypothetical protein
MVKKLLKKVIPSRYQKVSITFKNRYNFATKRGTTKFDPA